MVFLKKLNNIEELENMAKKVRRGIIEEVYEAQSGHPGGALSVADILTVLYFNILNIFCQILITTFF